MREQHFSSGTSNHEPITGMGMRSVYEDEVVWPQEDFQSGESGNASHSCLKERV
jgi:hypothetical protein